MRFERDERKFDFHGIGLAIKRAREQKGMTQEQLAQQLHINQSQISCYIHGKKLPALDTLANLCKILDVDANYILCQDLKNN